MYARQLNPAVRQCLEYPVARGALVVCGEAGVVRGADVAREAGRPAEALEADAALEPALARVHA